MVPWIQICDTVMPRIWFNLIENKWPCKVTNVTRCCLPLFNLFYFSIKISTESHPSFVRRHLQQWSECHPWVHHQRWTNSGNQLAKERLDHWTSVRLHADIYERCRKAGNMWCVFAGRWLLWMCSNKWERPGIYLVSAYCQRYLLFSLMFKLLSVQAKPWSY